MVLTSRLFDRRITEILDKHSQISLSQWRVLAQLGIVQTGTVRSLSEGAAADRSEVSRVLKHLELQQLVVRTSNQQDLRSPNFSLNDNGRAMFEKIRTPISAFISHLVDKVSPEDLEAADRVLKAVALKCS